MPAPHYYNNAERIIYEHIYAENNQKTKRHKTSGKLSPSKLATPTQTAILTLLGVKPDPIYHRVYGTFTRGNEVEAAVFRGYRHRDNGAESQIEYNTRNTVGFCDFKSEGTIYEVKSKGAAGFKYLSSNRVPQPSHAIQLSFYLLAAGHKVGRLLYVCADNYATIEFPIYLKTWRAALEYRINAVHYWLDRGELPDYLPLEPFHKLGQYTPFGEFYKSKGEEAEAILKEKYPEAYRKLKSKEIIKSWDKLPLKNLTPSQGALKKYFVSTQSQEIAISSYGAKCANCFTRLLSDQYTITETSRVYLEACRHKVILPEQDGK